MWAGQKVFKLKQITWYLLFDNWGVRIVFFLLEKPRRQIYKCQAAVVSNKQIEFCYSATP